VVYFCIVLPAGKLMARFTARQKLEEDALAAAEITELRLLGEIRDLLARQA